MSSSINIVAVSGNLTRDASLRRTNSGMAVLEFSVAVNERRKNRQTGEWEESPSYVDCTMFGDRAERIAEYLTKGTKAFVSGRLHQERWQDKETGKGRSKLGVTVDEIDFSRRDGGKTSRGQQPDLYAADIPF